MGDQPQDVDDIYSGGKPPANSDDESFPSRGRSNRFAHRLADLRLDIDAAMNGRIDNLLPEGFRDPKCGLSYPLPTKQDELQVLTLIPVLSNNRDSGSIYVRRAIKAWKRKQGRKLSALHDTDRKEAKIENAQREFSRRAKELKAEAQEIVNGVRVEAEKAIASLHDLFTLGREGMGGIMKAHLAGQPWQGEQVTTDQFMGCFRMVSQTVKGMGVAPDQRDKARDVVMEEVAKSVEATRSALSGSTEDDEVQH